MSIPVTGALHTDLGDMPALHFFSENLEDSFTLFDPYGRGTNMSNSPQYGACSSITVKSSMRIVSFS
jgi:hypothetical protein